MPTTLTSHTRGRGPHALDRDIAPLVARQGGSGLCHLFVQHTSCSLILTENVSPEVWADLETLMGRTAPDGDPAYRHDDEGPDDMAAHFRTVVAGHDLSIPYQDGRLMLGTWQGIFLWEHRHHPHSRRVVVTFLPEASPGG